MNSMSTSVDLKSVFDLPTGGDAGMNVLLVTTGINPASGGPTHPVKGLCRALDRAGVNVTLLVLNGRHPFEDRGKVQVLRGARINVADYDLVHLQGLWHWGLHNVAVACRKYHVPYVVSSRGMLDPWALGVKRRKILEELKRHGSWRPMEPIGCDWMRMWGYFVAPSDGAAPRQTGIKPRRAVRVLWVGRLLAWKRVHTLFRAVAACLERFPIELTVVGDGPERGALERLGRHLFARHLAALTFRHSVSIGEVRTLMRSHDVYALPSNGYEGWGAVVNEALEEGMIVLGTRQAGACATMLDERFLFDEGDVQALSLLLEKARAEFVAGGIGAWSASSGTARLLKEAIFHV